MIPIIRAPIRRPDERVPDWETLLTWSS